MELDYYYYLLSIAAAPLGYSCRQYSTLPLLVALL